MAVLEMGAFAKSAKGCKSFCVVQCGAKGQSAALPGFNIRYHLRVNLLRKYLRYTDRSRALVPIQDWARKQRDFRG